MGGDGRRRLGRQRGDGIGNESALSFSFVEDMQIQGVVIRLAEGGLSRDLLLHSITMACMRQEVEEIDSMLPRGSMLYTTSALASN